MAKMSTILIQHSWYAHGSRATAAMFSVEHVARPYTIHQDSLLDKHIHMVTNNNKRDKMM